MTPRKIAFTMMPVIVRIARDAKPAGHCWPRTSLPNAYTPMPMSMMMDRAKAKAVAIRNGTTECSSSPSIARLTSFQNENFEAPLVLSSRSYSTPVCSKPKEAINPRRYGW